MIKNIFWDLDGTLTDSSEGITNCARLALSHYGFTGYEKEQLLSFIGPPLRESFPKYGIPEAEVENAIKIFRERYTTIGKFENSPYAGIKELLKKLKDEGFRHYVATSKPEETAKQILDKFEMTDYFEIICGATMDGRIDSKESVIAYLLENIGEIDNVIMVGDTEFDVIGAKEHNIRTIGVSWGFGSKERMFNEGAVAVVDTMDELFNILKTL